MGLFNRKTSLLATGIFKEFTDWHSHILPGVDDGVKTLEESLEILGIYEKLGVKTVWLTPHIMEDIPNTTDGLRKRFEELREAYRGGIELHLASENMADNLLSERLEQGDLLPIGEEGKHLLIETSYLSAPVNFDEVLFKVKKAGYQPILAHPERYTYMDEREYSRLLAHGVIFQINMFSVVGCYGETVKKKAKMLLQMQKSQFGNLVPLPKGALRTECAVSLVGTDLHSLRQLNQYHSLPDIPTPIARQILQTVTAE